MTVAKTGRRRLRAPRPSRDLRRALRDPVAAPTDPGAQHDGRCFQPGRDAAKAPLRWPSGSQVVVSHPGGLRNMHS
jgi:hypothetical protein